MKLTTSDIFGTTHIDTTEEPMWRTSAPVPIEAEQVPPPSPSLSPSERAKRESWHERLESLCEEARDAAQTSPDPLSREQWQDAHHLLLVRAQAIKAVNLPIPTEAEPGTMGMKDTGR